MHSILIIALAAVLMLLPAGAEGQNVSHSHMVEMFRRGVRVQSSPQVLAISDSLTAMAKKAGDREMELRGMVLRMRYWLQHADTREQIDRAVDPYIAKCQQYGFEPELYEGVSTKATWLTNKGLYKEALDYQDKMMKYARKHNHRYGIVIGNVSVGNIHRMRMDMARAIYHYQKALENRRIYALEFDPGQNQKRIAECYIIAGHFDNAIRACDEGIMESSDDRRIGGLLGMKAFSLFMLRRDAEFRTSYAAYKSYDDVKPDIQPLLAQCLDVMNLIDKGDFAEVDRRMAKVRHIGFWLYVDIARYVRQDRYLEALATMQNLNISLYGDSKGTLTVECARVGTDVKNNMQELDRQKAEYENSLLELVRKNLELKNAQLEIGRLHSAENIAKMNAENKGIELNNQRMEAKQLSDSLANMKIRRESNELAQRSWNVWIASVLVAVLLLLALEYFFYRHHKKMAAALEHVNERLRHTHDEMDVASAKALESDRQKTEFIRNMSHEIRTPLNSIVGFTQLLTDTGSNFAEEEGQYMKESIRESSSQLQTLITSILDLTALESGKYKMRLVETSVNDICRRAIENAKDMVKGGVNLQFVTDFADDATLLTDPERLQQIIETLLSNAAKFTERGFIHLSCRKAEQEDKIIITVADSGCGISEEQKDKVFALFCKGDKFQQGTGLGLYMARVIATQLGGEIFLDGKYTGGSRFCVELPL